MFYEFDNIMKLLDSLMSVNFQHSYQNKSHLDVRKSAKEPALVLQY